jgi:hypothetical protein
MCIERLQNEAIWGYKNEKLSQMVRELLKNIIRHNK